MTVIQGIKFKTQILTRAINAEALIQSAMMEAFTNSNDYTITTTTTTITTTPTTTTTTTTIPTSAIILILI